MDGDHNIVPICAKYAAALKAYGNVYKDDGAQNAYIDVAQEALWRQLMSELSKIYDRKSTCGSDNCSIRQLRQCCLNHATAMHGKSSELIAQLDALCERYESLFSRELRNKKLAHYDLKAVFRKNHLQSHLMTLNSSSTKLRIHFNKLEIACLGRR